MLGSLELGELYDLVSLKEDTHEYSVRNDSRTNYISPSTCVTCTFPKFESQKFARFIVNSPKFSVGPYAKFRNFKDPIEAIQKEWQRIGQEAIDLGVKLHADIENYYKSGGQKLPDPMDDESFKQFLNFDNEVRRVNNWTPYVSELRIRDVDFTICGTIDMLFTTKSGDLVMVDWKRSKKNFDESRNSYGLGPLCNVPASQLNKYSLQQNIYSYIFNKEKNSYATTCGRKIIEMYLLQMHENLPNYQLLPVFNFDESTIEKCLLYTIDNC